MKLFDASKVIPIHDLDTYNGNGTWTALGDAVSVATLTTNFMEGGGAVSFGATVAGTTSNFAGVYCNGFSAITTLSTYEGKGGFSLWCYLPLTDTYLRMIESLVLRIGSDTTNYDYITLTGTSGDYALQNLHYGWNRLWFPWAGAETEGTPVLTSVDYAAFVINYTASMGNQSGILIDELSWCESKNGCNYAEFNADGADLESLEFTGDYGTHTTGKIVVERSVDKAFGGRWAEIARFQPSRYSLLKEDLNIEGDVWLRARTLDNFSGGGYGTCQVIVGKKVRGGRGEIGTKWIVGRPLDDLAATKAGNTPISSSYLELSFGAQDSRTPGQTVALQCVNGCDASVIVGVGATGSEVAKSILTTLESMVIPVLGEQRVAVIRGSGDTSSGTFTATPLVKP